MNKYLVILEHDKGKIKILVAATSYAKAIEIMMEIEKCPENAIKSIRLIQ